MKYFFKVAAAFWMSTGPLSGVCQNTGILFSGDTSWNQVLQSARSRGKFILVDCYATWCAPCRAMDEKVYNEDSVGAFFNERFVSIKLQMDTSKGDDERVKARYAVAADMATRYHVTAFPTFLFFTSDGMLVHRGEGYQSAIAFVNMAKDALDPRKQYYTMVEDCRKEKLDGDRVPYLIGEALEFNDTAVAKEAAAFYISHTLSELPHDSLYQSKYIGFLDNCLGLNIVHAGEKGFYLVYGHERTIDSVMGVPMYAEGIVDFSISKAEIFPRLWKGRLEVWDSPDWAGIKRVVERKYGLIYAERSVAFDKIRWYKWKKDFPGLVRCTMDLMARYSAGIGDWDRNVYAWTIFQHDTTRADLDAAIEWMQPVLKTMGEKGSGLDTFKQGEVLDTYANLLYKKGETSAGIAWERKACQLASIDKDVQADLKKMQEGVPTWPTN